MNCITTHSAEVTGIQVCVYHHGKIVASVCGGTLSDADPRPVQENTLFNVFSVTKAVLAATVHALIDSGDLALDRRVIDYWPEFAAHPESCKATCTVSDALSHKAGLHSAIGISVPVQQLCQFDEMVRRIEQAEPAHPPGQEYHYHYLSYGWLLGGLVQKVTGKPLAQVVHERIIEPLGLSDEFYMCTGVPDTVLKASNRFAQLTLGNMATPELPIGADQLVAKLYSSAPQGTSEEEKTSRSSTRLTPLSFNLRSVRAANVPAANGHCSARALAKFYSALATGN